MLCLFAVFAFSCNEEMERLLTDDYPESGTEYTTGHVLMVVIDGASGIAVNEAYNTRKAPVIRSMTDKSLFTFYGLADNEEGVSKERGWANLLTGTTKNGLDVNQGIDELETPSFLQRLKEADENLKVSFYSSDTEFFGAFGSVADTKRKTSADSETADALIAEINGETISDIVVAQFGGVQQIGEQHGFWSNETTPTSEVIDAIYNVDAFIGKIMKVLEARPRYVQENWLVVITSSYGGVYEGNVTPASLYDDPRLNSFMMLYNSRFASKLLQRPGSDELQYKFYSPYFVGPGQKATTNAVMTGNTEFFNMGKRWSSNPDEEVDKSGYTIQFKMFDKHGDPWGNRNIISKRYQKAGTGWQLMFSNNTQVEFAANFKEGSSVFRLPSTRRDGSWHSYTLVIKEVDDTQKGDSILFYLDGKYQMGCKIDGSKDMWTDAPLAIGHTFSPDRPNQANLYINDLQFYNVALPADIIAEYHCTTKLDLLGELYPYWNNLVGYYPNDREDDIGLSYLEDYSKYTSKDKRLYFNKPVGTFAPTDDYVTRRQESIVTDKVCPLIDDSYYKTVLNTVDLSYQIFKWFGEPVDSSWNFDGEGWALDYVSLNN